MNDKKSRISVNARYVLILILIYIDNGVETYGHMSFGHRIHSHIHMVTWTFGHKTNGHRLFGHIINFKMK